MRTASGGLGCRCGTAPAAATPRPGRAADGLDEPVREGRAAERRVGRRGGDRRRRRPPAARAHRQLTGPWQDLVAAGIGQLTRAFGTAPGRPGGRRPRGWPARQRHDRRGRTGSASRRIVHEECLTGLAAWQATVYPSPLCWGASFDPDAGRADGRADRRDRCARSASTRAWRRCSTSSATRAGAGSRRPSARTRTWSARSAAPTCAGLESAGVVATLKHFVGYSASRAGRNLAPVSVGPRELADVLLPPFEMALRAGAPLGDELLHRHRRRAGRRRPRRCSPTCCATSCGFNGTVVADYFSVAFLQTLHGVAGGAGRRGRGWRWRPASTSSCPPSTATASRCSTPCEAGEVDVGARRPGAGAGAAPEVRARPARRGLVARAAGARAESTWTSTPRAPRAGPASWPSASIVLLRQRRHPAARRRPRASPSSGPRADDPRAMLGCYSFPRHVGVHHPDVPLGIDCRPCWTRCGRPGRLRRHATRRAARCSAATTRTSPAAVAAAADADVCVAVLGDRAGLFGARHLGRGLRRDRPAAARPPGGAAGGAARHRHPGRAGAAGRPPVRAVPAGRPAGRRRVRLLPRRGGRAARSPTC